VNTADWIRAFRFGFGPGPSPADAFDPISELARGTMDGAAEARELAAEMILAHKAATAAQDLRKTDPGRYKQVRRDSNRHMRKIYNSRLHAMLVRHATSDQPFLCRLSGFWLNHFALGKLGSKARLAAAYFEAVAVWPNITRNFADLLIAAELFPAMIYYLNLQNSVGPNSPLGKATGRGINENLGREILELHTMGADGGYTQADVTALAHIMTGWRVDGPSGRTGFDQRRAEPGAKTLLGRTFAAGGGSQFHDALRMLAIHPATARHVGAKLAQHFIGPGHDAAAARLAAVFEASRGELRPVYETLVALAKGQPFGLQMRNDHQFLVSALRAAPLRPGALDAGAADGDGDGGRGLTVGAMRMLTQQLLEAPAPAGWPDDPAYWRSPEVLKRRLRWLPRLIGQIPADDPVALAERALGPLARPETLATMRLASNRQEAMGLILASPEFNRR
jgi:uncharacterized protein (DUF1800 family)